MDSSNEESQRIICACHNLRGFASNLHPDDVIAVEGRAREDQPIVDNKTNNKIIEQLSTALSMKVIVGFFSAYPAAIIGIKRAPDKNPKSNNFSYLREGEKVN